MSPSFRMADIGGGTPRAEALLEEKRRLLRNALKAEYIKWAAARDNLDLKEIKHM